MFLTFCFLIKEGLLLNSKDQEQAILRSTYNQVLVTAFGSVEIDLYSITIEPWPSHGALEHYEK